MQGPTNGPLYNVPEEWIEVIMHFIAGFRNDTVDFSQPHLRPSVARIYPLFVFLYAALVLVGTLANLAVLCTIARRRLHRDPTYGYLLNLALADIAMCVLVLPVSLVILLVQNWVFGRFLCYFLPMMQDIPLHVAMLTFLLIAVDRYRLTLDPTKPRLPVFFCTVGTWLLAVCFVLPYPIYTTYLDLGSVMKTQFEGVSICVVNIEDNVLNYVRSLFVVMYVLPMAGIVFFFVRASRKLKVRAGMMLELHSRETRSDFSFLDRPQNYVAELDLTKEKRTQKYLIAMVTIFAICLCPLMVLRLTKLAFAETYENSGYFDLTFTMFVWIAFLPTCTMPCIFAFWRMSRQAKKRLCCHFQCSQQHACRYCGCACRRQQQQLPSELCKVHTSICHSVSGCNVLIDMSRGVNCYQHDLTSS